ncbi:hypothetical protein BDV29DRAFT_152710 [Aspergillus leporis]|uniref:Uncharacterized protein n=1 Tax=Aspergillus leporis TaxID=41062 RepID=A0A5N5XCA3_9EURO|nr:hypothetical protein BDV29DRAFT_152710 [Aspergillus leporis]
MKIAIVLSALVAVAVAAPTPHSGHVRRAEEGTTVDDICEALYGAWRGIKKREEEGTTVDDISEALYGTWGGIKKRDEDTTVDDISKALPEGWKGGLPKH